MFGEFGEAEDGLLCSYKSTGGVNDHVSVKSLQRDGEGVIGRRERQGAGCEPLVFLFYFRHSGSMSPFRCEDLPL